MKDCLPSEEEPIAPDDDNEEEEDEDKIDWGNILLVVIGALIGCAVGVGASELIRFGKNKKKSKQNETDQTEKEEEDNKSETQQ